MTLDTEVRGAPTRGKSNPVRPRVGRTGIRLLQVLSFVVVILVWAVISMLGIVSPLALPNPFEVLVTFVGNLVDPTFWISIGQTLTGAIVGLAIACVIGIPLGLITGTYVAAEKSSRILVDILRSFPVIAILPVFLLVIGSKPQTEITVVFIACLFPILLQAQYGAQSVTSMVSETVRSYRIPRGLRFFKVILPAATPSIMTGIRIAATTAVLVAVGVEILTTLPGVGHEILTTQQGANAPLAYSYIVTAGLLGFGVNRISEVIEKRLLRWRPPTETN